MVQRALWIWLPFVTVIIVCHDTRWAPVLSCGRTFADCWCSIYEKQMLLGLGPTWKLELNGYISSNHRFPDNVEGLAILAMIVEVGGPLSSCSNVCYDVKPRSGHLLLIGLPESPQSENQLCFHCVTTASKLTVRFWGAKCSISGAYEPSLCSGQSLRLGYGRLRFESSLPGSSVNGSLTYMAFYFCVSLCVCVKWRRGGCCNPLWVPIVEKSRVEMQWSNFFFKKGLCLIIVKESFG